MITPFTLTEYYYLIINAIILCRCPRNSHSVSEQIQRSRPV
ncbi:hypothetical protein BN903_259 [Halorubrum sp. AJ67]|nr:hypothetical protein BN903_259 [Halorubrum sp. AJ67]